MSEFPVGAPRESGVILIVDRATGRVRTATGVFERLDALAAFVTEIFSAKLTALATMDLQDDLEELVITTKRYWALARPLPLEHPSLVVLLFEPTRATLPMQRLELDRFMAALDAWTSL